MRLVYFLFVFVITFSVFVTGCSESIDEEPVTLKVLYSDELSFLQQYGQYNMLENDHFDVEVVSIVEALSKPGEIGSNEEKILRLIEKEKPDVLYVSLNNYKQLREQKKLLPIDNFIKETGFDVDKLHRAIPFLLRDPDTQQLHGLATHFYSAALFYNQEIFEQAGIPLPSEQMSWNELKELVFQLRGIPSTEPYYVFSSIGYTSPIALGIVLGGLNGLQMIDVFEKKVTIHTDKWKEMFGLSIDFYKAEVIPPVDEDGLELFLQGKLALIINDIHLVAKLQKQKATWEQFERQKPYDSDWKDKLEKPVKWGLTSLPTNQPGVANSYYVRNVFAIHADTAHQKEAWELFQLINSDTVAKVNSNIYGFNEDLLARAEYISDVEGVSLMPFIINDPSGIPAGEINTEYQKLPNQYFYTFASLAEEQFAKVMDGSQSVDEALKNLQESGQKALDEAFALSSE